MGGNLNSFEMEGDLNFFENMEDDLNSFENGRQP